MRQRVITDGIAHWHAGERHTVRITDEADGLLDWFLIAMPRDRPGLETLWHTSWHAYPGSEWQEEPSGCWSRPVFRHGISSGSEAGP